MSARWVNRLLAQIGVRLGHTPSLVTLGAIYETDPSLSDGLQRANQLYRRAAEHGNAQAMCNLGINFLSSKGGETDHDQALHWLDRAAVQDQPMACWALGRMYLAGRLVERDVGRGIELLRRAAAAGSSAAALSLAEIYKHGLHGVAADDSEAQLWAVRSRPLLQRLAIKLRLAQVKWPEPQ